MLGPEMSGIEQVVAIGGLGGSGTRLMARLMQEAGLAMGERLNRSLDDLWFSGLFKRPGSDLPLLPTEIQSRYSLFRKLREHERLGLGEFIQLRVEMRYEKDSRIFNDPPWKCLFQSDERPIRWGWKEPNTHLFLKTLLKEESRLRYIHLIRDGRYMAFSAEKAIYLPSRMRWM